MRALEQPCKNMNRLVRMLGGNLSQPVDDAVSYVRIEVGINQARDLIPEQPGRGMPG
jgi:hypothetical protein